MNAAQGHRTPWTTARATLAMAVVAAGVVLPTTSAGAATSLQPIADGIIGGPGHATHYGWGQDTIPPGLPGAGNVVSTDYWNFKVTEFTPDGALVGDVIPSTGTGGPPYDVAVNPVNGNIAVGDVDGGAQVDI